MVMTTGGSFETLRLGMVLAFKPSASLVLAHLPARVVHIWPRFRSGDYLVTLEYETPIKTGREVIKQLDAFLSELYQPEAGDLSLTRRHPLESRLETVR